MNLGILIGGIGMFLAWGVWGFTAKLAVREIGLQALFWGQLASTLIFPLYFLVFKDMLPFKIDAAGIGWGLATGALGALGTLILYALLRAAPASVVIPMSGLYPVITVALAYIFLHEEISLTRILGVFCALAAVWLLTV